MAGIASTFTQMNRLESSCTGRPSEGSPTARQSASGRFSIRRLRAHASLPPALAFALALALALALSLAIAPERALASQMQNITTVSESKTFLEVSVNATKPPKDTEDAKRDFSETYAAYLESTANDVFNGNMPSYSKKPKITNLKYSKKGIANVEFMEPVAYQGTYSGLATFTVVPKKAGTTKISFNVKVGSKIVKKCVLNVTVHKYDKAFETFKIGKVNLAKKLDSTGTYVRLKEKKLSGRLVMKAAKNWDIEVSNLYKPVKNGPDAASKLESGKKYSISSGRVCVMLHNSVDGRYRTVNLVLE